MFYFLCANKKYRQGQAMITAVLFFVSISLVIVLGLASPIVRSLKSSHLLVSSKQSRALSEGLLEDVLYRYKNGVQVSTVETISEGPITAYATSTTILNGTQVVSSGNADRAIRKISGILQNGSGMAFFYGVQSDRGGMDLNNSAEVQGSVFSNGPVTGDTNLVKGDVISAGSSGLMGGVHATGTAFAHQIQNSTIDKDAYYQTISGSTVGGASHPGSPDQDFGTLPISDDQISQWETEAAAGGTVSCSGGEYHTPSNTTLGPKKIPCNLDIEGSDTINLAGPIWITGNIEIMNSARINVASSLSGRTVPVIADNPSNRSTGSKISIGNSAQFTGYGSNSYIIFLSQNNSAETGGGNDAITISNSARGDVLLYAGHGRITISNSVTIKEVTAYRIVVNNSAKVIYNTGLANLLFSAGPSGGYTIGGWADQ